MTTWVLVFMIFTTTSWVDQSQSVIPNFASLEECRAAGEQLKKELLTKKIDQQYAASFSCVAQKAPKTSWWK